MSSQVIEAGFEIDPQTLRQVGGRAIGASIVGMLCGAGPLAFGIAKARRCGAGWLCQRMRVC